MFHLAGLGGEQFVEFGILREVIRKRQDDIIEEQQPVARLGVGHIGKLLGGDVQPLRHQLAVARGQVQQVDKIAVFQNVFNLRRGKQVLRVLRRPGRDAAPLPETLPDLGAVCRRLFLLQEQVKFVHEIPGGPSNGAVHRDGVPHCVLDNEHPWLFQILAEALDIEADKAVSDIHGGAVVEEVERAVYIQVKCLRHTLCLRDALRHERVQQIAQHGHILRPRIREVRLIDHTDNGKVLDYLADFSTHSLQTVEFGKNLLDVKISRDHTERASALIPLGALIKETDAEGQKIETNRRVDITSVNDGKNYVCDEDAVSEIGWIWTSEIWEDVTLPGNLLRKAKARMQELAKGVTSMELTIVDESDAGADIGDIRARMYVRCISKPHSIDGTYLCLSRTVDYLNPAGNTITIGANGITLSSASAKQDQNISDLSDELVGVTGEIKTINEQKMYRTETYVDGVNIFRDKGQHSILRCRVFSWDKEITELLDASSFVWHRNSGDEAADADWDASHVGMKYITVTTEDVQDNTSFYCEITI